MAKFLLRICENNTYLKLITTSMVQRSICVGTNLDGAKFTFIYVLKHTQG